MKSFFHIRRSTPDDAEGMVRAHYSAVHETAKNDYPRAILELWSKPVDAHRIAACRAKVKTAQGVISFVAVGHSGQVLGYGELVPPQTLGAIYVAASAGRRGVGSELLKTVEEKARELGMHVLTMESSLTAVPFYVKHGFQEVERRTHPLADGVMMDCVYMEKKIQGKRNER